MLKTLWRWLWRSIALFVAVVLIYQLWIFAHIWWWVDHNPSTSAFMEQRLEVLQSKQPDAELRHQWVPYNRISNNLKRALIAAEDSKFLDHEGFDWESIQKAYEKNQKKGKLVAGGSTISQQLAKNLFLSSRKVFWRKAEEAVITVMLEKMMSKRRILEVYLNVIEWGNGVFGAEAAARHYYKTSASSLSAEQAARLASMVPNPRYFDTHRNSRGLERKTGIILARMNQVQAP
ncbi:monofunctional biosynthetic peptidoglycan transglycosylase [Sulfuricella denitrificans skB26]|uniref:Biosynthetic peptidoglycan transglycosylase n=1 Tax=Sulfuricella denitrificans (strain DSM 22764 / NBRC 105220 / skB26) TaxID=1163617 RepID=S6A9F9_SULDS|nr:monofunctional biosynthetic peptidoglycan transglycosylase [Sulfuricella denitrificans]BAN34040.1 monofunctional biosynthetic peptidoglycan transglycosylase [Sulfuricella denitrificans skB26]